MWTTFRLGTQKATGLIQYKKYIVLVMTDAPIANFFILIFFFFNLAADAHSHTDLQKSLLFKNLTLCHRLSLFSVADCKCVVVTVKSEALKRKYLKDKQWVMLQHLLVASCAYQYGVV